MQTKGRVMVTLTNDEVLYGPVDDFDLEGIQAVVDKVMQAEGQGTFVMEVGMDWGWVIIPTRSIVYVGMERVDDKPSTFFRGEPLADAAGVPDGAG